MANDFTGTDNSNRIKIKDPKKQLGWQMQWAMQINKSSEQNRWGTDESKNCKETKTKDQNILSWVYVTLWGYQKLVC